MVAAVDPGSTVAGVTRLTGGLSAATSAVDLVRPGGERRSVVLKRFHAADQARYATGEHLRLGVVAERVAGRLATPSPVALDAKGSWFGAPALVMTRLPGGSTLQFEGSDWPEQLAFALAALHAADATSVPDEVAGDEAWQRAWIERARPRLSRGPWPDAVAAFHGLLPAASSSGPRCLIHGDYHPGQVLWDGAALTGVIDWANLRLGRPGDDVATCRTDVVMFDGRRAADRFLTAYESLAGPVADLPVWELGCAIRARAFSHYWLRSFHEGGRPQLTLPMLRRRLAVMAARALARLT